MKKNLETLNIKDEIVEGGFMKQLLQYGRTFTFSNSSSLILLDLWKAMGQSGEPTIENIQKVYLEMYFGYLCRSFPNAKDFIKQEPSKCIAFETYLRAIILQEEMAKKEKALEEYKDVDPVKLACCETYFNDFLDFVRNDKYKVERKQANEKQDQFYKKEEYELETAKLLDFFDLLVDKRVIADSHYHDVDFLRDVARGDFSNSISAFDGITKLQIIVELIYRHEYIKFGLRNWIEDVAKSIGSTKSKCDTEYNKEKNKRFGKYYEIEKVLQAQEKGTRTSMC